METAHVTDCSVSSCSYNHDGCHALAVNVKGAGCSTFISLNERGGLDRVVTSVGACQSADCAHNKDLECTAAAVRIGAGESSDTANCLTYSKA